MANPNEILLITRKNKFDKPIFTYNQPYTINSESFYDIGAISKEDYAKCIIEFRNSGSNNIDIEIYGTIMDSQEGVIDQPRPPPPDFSSNVWRLLDNGSLTVTPAEIIARSISDYLEWVLIRAKKATGADTTLNLYVVGT